MSDWATACRAVRGSIRSVPDFPEPGILFRDITPLLASPSAFGSAVDWYADRCLGVDAIAGVEARGFIFGAATADRLGAPFIPVRKPGKLPGATLTRRYELEYGRDRMEIQADAVSAGMRIALVDDVLATGGTLSSAGALLTAAGAELTRIAVLIELVDLCGRKRLQGHLLDALVRYQGDE